MAQRRCLHFCTTFINIIIGLVIWVTAIIPSLITVTLPWTIFRLSVHFLAQRFQPDLIPVTNVVENCVIINASSEYPVMNTAQVWKLRGKLDVQAFRQHFYTVFLSTEDLREKYRNLYCYFVQWGFYCFKKPVETIILEDRIKQHKLKDGENLDSFIGTWMATNDYGNRPNWEILIIHMENDGNGVNEDLSESVLLFKIDHGLCDGYTFVHLVDKLSGLKSPYIVKDDETGFWMKIKYTLTFPAIFLKLGLQASLTKAMLPPSRLAKKAPTWFMSFTTVDLQVIKKVRQKAKCHFNTLVGMLHIGALRRHLLDTGKVRSVSKLPDYTWLSSAAGWPGHPAMIHGGMTNHLTIECSQVPFRETDPLRRLKVAEDNFLESLDDGFRTMYRWFFVPIIWPIPSPLFRLAIRHMSDYMKINHVVSPLMCSGEQYQLMGHQVDHLYLPVHVPGLFPAIQMYVVPASNSGRLDLSISATSELFKSQEEIDFFTKVYMKEELDKLVHSCGLGWLDDKV